MSLNCVRIRNILIIILILVLSIPVIVTADSHQFNFTNNCNQPVWVNVAGGPPGTCDVPPAINIDPSTGTNLKCSACSLCPDQSLCNTSVSTGASLPLCCPLITDPPVCWGGEKCAKGNCCPLIPQTADQTYGCPGVSSATDNCGNTSMTFEQIAALSGYNNSTSGRHPAVCNGSIIGGGGFKLEANGGTQSYPVDDGWQGAWWGRTNCSFTGDLGSCETGNCLAADGWGHLQCSGVGSAAPSTIGEMTMAKTTGIDNYDVSLVGGYNLPMQITPQDYNPAYADDHFQCTSAACLNSSALSSCPADLTYLPNGNLVGCQDDCSLATIYHDVSPYYFTQPQVDAYCCPDATYCSPLNPCGPDNTCAAWIQNPSTCLNCNATNGGIYPNGYPPILTNSALYFHATFPNAYSFTYDDASASYTCNSTPSTGLRTKYDITFCAQSSAPVAAFTGSPTSGTAPLTVTFTDSSTGSPTSWSWNFGDGGTSTEKNPAHAYTIAGTYTVALTATNSAGSNTKTVDNYITVTSVMSESRTGVYRPGDGFYLKSDNGNTWTSTDLHLTWDNAAGDLPVAGDWNAEGMSRTGVYRPGDGFYLKKVNSNTWTSTDLHITWDNAAGDRPVAGDWNNDGTYETGVYRPGDGFYLKMDNSNTWTSNDLHLTWDNAAGDRPVAGDWNNDGTSETGVYRPGDGFYLKMDNSNTWNSNDLHITWDNAALDLPVAGDWNNDGTYETGVYRPGDGFYLKMDNSNTWTSNDLHITWDNAAGDLPIAGNFV